MTSDIIVALVVSGFSLTGTVIGARMGIREANKLTIYRIGELEKKVDKHNKVIERTANLEGAVKELDQKLDAKALLIDQKIEAKCDLVDRRFKPIEQALAL